MQLHASPERVYNNRRYCTFVPPPRVRVRATVKLSAAFFHDESSITIGGYESAIAPNNIGVLLKGVLIDLHAHYFVVCTLCTHSLLCPDEGIEAAKELLKLR